MEKAVRKRTEQKWLKTPLRLFRARSRIYIFFKETDQTKVFSMDSENSETDHERSPGSLSFKRLYREVRDEEIENAINYLALNIPEDVLREAFEKFKPNFDFIGKEYFGLGMDIRNLLYREEFDLGELDDNWIYLLWKTSEKVCGKEN